MMTMSNIAAQSRCVLHLNNLGTPGQSRAFLGRVVASLRVSVTGERTIEKLKCERWTGGRVAVHI